MTEHRDQRHILFVDDDAASRRLVERMLRSGVADARVTCVEDGVQALAVLERERVDLLITDLAMPVMDGIELLRQVGNRRMALPVIVVTGHGSPADETRALAGGALDYIEKPIEAESLVRCVHDLLAGAGHRSRIEGLSIAGFVQLLTMERKTCALRASVPEAQGVLFFNAGVLVDARQAGLSGAEAALEIFTWKEPIITLEAQARGRPTTIHVSVTELLLESARLADERERNLRRRSSQIRSTARADTTPAVASSGVGLANAGKAPALSLVAGRRPAPRAVPAPVSATPERESAAAREVAAERESAAARELAAAREAAPEQESAAARELAPERELVAWERPEAQVTIARLLAEAMKIDGAIGAAVAHWELDHCLGALGEGSPTRADLAVTGNCKVMRALMTGMLRLGLRARVQDVIFTLDEQSHVLWPLPQHEGLFLYLATDRAHGTPALTRLRLQRLVEMHKW